MTQVREDWSRHAGFQRVRSTVEIFAATAYYWMREHAAIRWAPELVGVGDLPLPVVVEQILSSGGRSWVPGEGNLVLAQAPTTTSPVLALLSCRPLPPADFESYDRRNASTRRRNISNTVQAAVRRAAFPDHTAGRITPATSTAMSVIIAYTAISVSHGVTGRAESS